MGDNGVAGPPAKKRVASRQLSKDDGSESEGEAPLPLEGGAFQKASEQVMASRRIVKIRRTAGAPTSAPNPFAGVRLVPPSTTVGEPPAASPPTGQPVLESTDSPGTGDGTDTSPALSAPPGLSEDMDSKNFEATHNELESGKDYGKPEETDNGNLDAGVIENVPREMKAEEGRFPGIEDVGHAKQSAVHAEEDEVGAGNLAGKLQDGSGSLADDENGRVDQHDRQDKEKQGDLVDRAEKGDMNDQVETGHVDKKEESISVQAAKVFAKVSDPISSEKTGFASVLGSIGTGFSNSAFSFGTAPSSFGTPTGFASFRPSWAFGSDSGSSSMSAFAFKASGEGAFPASSTAFGNSNGGTFQLFSSQSNVVSSVTEVSSSVPSSTGSFSFQEVPLETGEEQEKVVFAADATLFEFADGGWRERGKGEIKVNVPEDTGGRSRLLMRCKGNYRLLLNASLFPDIKTASMDSRGVTFACVNSAGEGKNGLTTYAVKLKDILTATGFREAVDTHKGKPHVDLKTPENSPRAPHETGRDTEASEP